MNSRITVIFIGLTIFINGCATVHKGYYDIVEIKNVPDDLTIQNAAGIDIPIIVQQHEQRVYNDLGKFTYTSTKHIALRSGKDHLLKLRFQGKEVHIEAHKKLEWKWFLMDILFGGIGCVVDYSTGNWNYFDSIDVLMLQ